MATERPIQIRIGICSFRRPDMLAKLLEALDCLDSRTPAFRVVVVDNDAAGSARQSVEAVSGRVHYPLDYDIEPQQNIALARNRCVRDLHEPWLAFIDDDEIPEAGWLLKLHEAAEQYQADAVFGPVVPGWSDDVPQWIRGNPVHNRARHRTGAIMPLGQTRTGNVLMKSSLLKGMSAPFDAAYGLTGGSDSDLFKRLAAQGAHYVWCDEAPVVEQVGRDRARPAWLLRRFFRGGHNHVRQQLSAKPRGLRILFKLFTLLRSLLLLMISLGGGLLLWPVARSRAFNLLCRAAGQAGQITALTPFEYAEYRPR